MLHVPAALLEGSTGGLSAAWVPAIFLEALADGVAHVRVPAAFLETATGGEPGKERVAAVVLEVLCQVPPEPPQMSLAIFPLDSQVPMSWSVHKAQSWATRTATHQSGREIRAAQQQYPIWKFTLTYEALASNGAYPTLVAEALQTIMGFFGARAGSFDSFLFLDPTDCQVTAGAIGTGDGGTLAFTLTRDMSGLIEPVGYVFAGDLTEVYVNGTLADPDGWSLVAPNVLTFTEAPAAAAAITATFKFSFVVRFAEDAQDFEQFMDNLWSAQEVKLMSVIQ
jgi:uncharacterized protein (TIGR02217 family)